jgi:hypothetical protein
MKILLIAILFLPTPSLASDETDAKALAEAQALLQNPDALRGPAGNPHEKAALAEVDKITKNHPTAKQEIQNLSSDIFADMVKKNGTGGADLGTALLEAQSDPGKFLRSLTPEQQKRIRDLASEIDKANGQKQK